MITMPSLEKMNPTYFARNISIMHLSTFELHSSITLRLHFHRRSRLSAYKKRYLRELRVPNIDIGKIIRKKIYITL